MLLGSLDDTTTPPGGDKTFIEVTIAPQQIDPSSGELTGKDKFVIRLDKAGNMYVHQAGTRTEEIDGDVNVTIKGDEARTVQGNQETRVSGNQVVAITQNHEIRGAGSTEDWSGNKVLRAKQLLLGGQAAAEPAVLGQKLVSWLLTHTHPHVCAAPGVTVTGLPVLPPMGAQLQNAALSSKVKVE